MASDQQNDLKILSDWKLLLLMFNPFVIFRNDRREYSGKLIVHTSEEQTFIACKSALHALDLHWIEHPNLGKLLVSVPGHNIFIYFNASYGLDIQIQLEKVDRTTTHVAIFAKSRRYLGFFRAISETGQHEARMFTEAVFITLISILERHNIAYENYSSGVASQSPSPLLQKESISANNESDLESHYQHILNRFLEETPQDDLGPSESLRICLLNNNRGLYDKEEAWFRQHPVFAVRACEEAIHTWNPKPWTKEQLLEARDLYQQRI